VKDKANLEEKFEQIKAYWSPKILGEVNGSYVKVFKAKGEFVWHVHEQDDECFLVVKGSLKIELRDQMITLNEGELFVVPKGVEHFPHANEEAWVLLFEPKQVINTGETESDKTVENPEWI